MQICLYGSEDRDRGSWGRVSRGMRIGLQAHGALAGYVPVREAALSLDAEDDGVPVEAGYDAPIAVHIGPPHRAGVMHARGQHRERWALIAPNSSWLPDMVHRTLPMLCTGYLSPSAWGAEILRRHAPAGFPVGVWRHGIDGAYAPTDGYPIGGSDDFRVLHLSSTALQRKGTHELLAAWFECLRRQAFGPDAVPRASLTLVLDAPDTVADAAGRAQRDDLLRRQLTAVAAHHTIRLRGRLDLTERDMAAYYARYHLVVQPSRGEGFGMVPLEALACGVPIVATRATGHAEWLGPATPGAVLVPYGPDVLVDDGPGALAPSVDVDELANALTFAYRYWSTLAEDACRHAETVRREWSWSAAVGHYLKSRGDVPPPPPSYPTRYPRVPDRR